jgi:hypothetical protein
LEEEPKLIERQLIDWLPDHDAYLVAARLEYTYFLTDSFCIELER